MPVCVSASCGGLLCADVAGLLHHLRVTRVDRFHISNSRGRRLWLCSLIVPHGPT